ncbi:MAG: hypothetical protein MJE68_30005 [Proteobacteria bacterium]|nr:hypothetical protein [Pseudomonadota bacterium]
MGTFCCTSVSPSPTSVLRIGSPTLSWLTMSLASCRSPSERLWSFGRESWSRDLRGAERVAAIFKSFLFSSIILASFSCRRSASRLRMDAR